jgi:hypothetical protein
MASCNPLRKVPLARSAPASAAQSCAGRWDPSSGDPAAGGNYSFRPSKILSGPLVPADLASDNSDGQVRIDPGEPSVSDVIGVAMLIISALVPLWTARAILGLTVNLMGKTNLPR